MFLESQKQRIRPATISEVFSFCKIFRQLRSKTNLDKDKGVIFNETQQSVMSYQIQVKGLVGSTNRNLKEEQEIAKAYAGAVVTNDDVFVVPLLWFKKSQLSIKLHEKKDLRSRKDEDLSWNWSEEESLFSSFYRFALTGRSLVETFRH